MSNNCAERALEIDVPIYTEVCGKMIWQVILKTCLC